MYAKDAEAYADKLQSTFKALPGELNLMHALRDQLTDMALDAAGNAALKWGGKALAKQAVGSAVPAWGNAVMALTSVVDAAVAVGDVAEIRAVATESLARMDVLVNKASELQDLAKRFGDPSKLTPGELHKLAVEGQDMLATLNDCTRARKCNLVPHTSNSAGSMYKPKDSKVEPADKGGCCVGQTGHHLIPEGSLNGQCSNYQHSVAPTVCVEGFTQNFG